MDMRFRKLVALGATLCMLLLLLVASVLIAFPSAKAFSRAASASPTTAKLGHSNGKIAFLGSSRESSGYAICLLDLNTSEEHCLTDVAEGIGREGFDWYP